MILLILVGFLMCQACAHTSTESITAITSCQYGACPAPDLNPLEEDPLIVTEEVTATSLLVVNNVNTLFAAAPYYTETTTVLIRTTLTSTEVSLSTTTVTTTHTVIFTESGFLTRILLDEAVEFSYTTGVTTVGPFDEYTTKISTQIFTSYALTTQTRSFTRISKSTSTAFTTSTRFSYIRLTFSEVITLSLLSSRNLAGSTLYIRQTIGEPDSVITSYLMTVTFTDFDTPVLEIRTVATETFPLFVASPGTALLTMPITFFGAATGTITILTPASTTLITDAKVLLLYSLMGLFTTDPFEDAIEKATSEMLPNAQEDLAATMEVCDMIKGKRVGAREAMRSLKRRLLHKNPNVQMLSIRLTDACFKNTGRHFLVELSSREFVDCISSLARSVDMSKEVGSMAKEYMQIWALLCKDEDELKYMYEGYQELLRSGLSFPPPPRHIDKKLTKTLAPPEWNDADQCQRCRVPFTLTLRKHHCRSCGNVFCQDCSSKTASLPEFGIPDQVRICESCHVKRVEAKYQYQKSAPLPVTPLEPARSEDEDSELALALKLSLQESQKDGYATYTAEPTPNLEAEEERMLKEAIEASLESSNVPAPAKVEEKKFELSPLDMENVKLFSQLVDRLSLSGSAVIEPEIEALAITMEHLRNTLKTIIYELKQISPELAGVQATLDISLTKYQLLKSMPRRLETRQTASANNLPFPPPHPQQIYAAYAPQSNPYYPVQAQAYPPPAPKADNEGQLLDEEPLIKL